MRERLAALLLEVDGAAGGYGGHGDASATWRLVGPLPETNSKFAPENEDEVVCFLLGSLFFKVRWLLVSGSVQGGK